MERKGTWIIAGAVLLGFAVCGLSYVFAQRADFAVERGRGEIGRYQVVRSNEEVIILLDTTTGDLYKATPSDIKPFNQRPRPEGRVGDREGDGFKDVKGRKGFKEDVERRFKDARRPMKDDFFPEEGKDKADFKEVAKDAPK